MVFKPKFISFDCYGTLINFEMGSTAKVLFKDRVSADRMPASDLGFMAKAFIDRGHEPTSSEYGVSRLTDIRQLPALLGL